MFNYRMVTWVEQPNEKQVKMGIEPLRLFDIKEVYYDKEGRPTKYIAEQNLFQYPDMQDLLGMFEKLERAKTMPILDLDSYKDKGY